MTKTLTEQWREGKIKEGYYYTLLNTDSKMIEINYCWDDGCFQDYCDNMIDEVLAPVPSYDEYKDLYDSNKQLMTHIKTCEQQIEHLQEQLKSANNAMKAMLPFAHNYSKERIEKYLKKWGVK